MDLSGLNSSGDPVVVLVDNLRGRCVTDRAENVDRRDEGDLIAGRVHERLYLVRAIGVAEDFVHFLE